MKTYNSYFISCSIGKISKQEFLRNLNNSKENFLLQYKYFNFFYIQIMFHHIIKYGAQTKNLIYNDE